jgi:anti-sigma regulatory factor (Ser/Thr protein kinase)/uncharacterized protein (DUF1330 family)
MLEMREKILGLAKKRKGFTTKEVLEVLGEDYSRQYVSRVIGELVRKGELVKAGSTRGARYALPSKVEFFGEKLRRKYTNEGLEEHEVWDSFGSMSFLGHLPGNVKNILAYAFMEMVNNAIEHSESKWIEVEVGKVGERIKFVIRDLGVGVFRDVMKKKRLDGELAAIQDILKGKTTTKPRVHSGEGIFFTSKVADVLVLESYGYQLRVDNLVGDVFVKEIRPRVKGTRVSFEISVGSKKSLEKVFAEYQAEKGSYAFDKTEVRVKLYAMGTEYLSRSQARRVLTGLEKFRSIVLDFDQVETVGQAFADEVFRVFRSRHPGIKITPVHMNEVVEFMVGRVEGSGE